MNQQRSSGVTLIELMIVVTIIGILAAIIYPSYSSYTTRARRADAKIALTKIAASQEKFFSDCNTYATSITAARTCADSGLNLSALSQDGYYQLQVAVTASNTAYTATATPVAGKAQAGDTACTALGITHLGAKTASGAQAATCWAR